MTRVTRILSGTPMIVISVLIALFIIWSSWSIRSVWHTAHGKKLLVAPGDEVCAAAFALSAWYLATKIVGWS